MLTRLLFFSRFICHFYTCIVCSPSSKNHKSIKEENNNNNNNRFNKKINKEEHSSKVYLFNKDMCCELQNCKLRKKMLCCSIPFRIRSSFLFQFVRFQFSLTLLFLLFFLFFYFFFSVFVYYNFLTDMRSVFNKFR